VVDPADIELYKRLGIGAKGGFGARPAVVVIDVQQRTVSPEYPASCGQAGLDAIPKISGILDAARSAGATVVFAYVAPKDERDSSRFATKFAVLQSVDQPGYAFLDELSPAPTDIMLPKRHPSVFFGTALTSYLIDRGIDTLIITGATTSGCVRATAVDAFAYGYKVVVPYEAVFDRVKTSHLVNLFDIDSKYGDVVSTDEVVAYLKDHGLGQAR
jgi:nicotinamidase-related amidase